MPHPHFLILMPSSDGGNVYIIGDVHGSSDTFHAALRELNAKDTLIVAGDLIDRGVHEHQPASALVLNTMMALNADPQRVGPRIYAIKGNHEQYFLQALTILRQHRDDREGQVETFKRYIKNGGAWIFKFPDAEKNEIFQRWSQLYACNRNLNQSGPEVEISLVEILTSDDPFEYLIPNIRQYEEYVSALPYIIKIEDGENTAWVAHADLIFSDEKLNELIDNDKWLNEDDIKYLTEARPREFKQSQRSVTSSVVYCGHNIIDAQFCQQAYPARPVRKDTNHINLDVGAYFTDALLLCNHTKFTAEVIGQPREQAHTTLLNYAKTQINAFLTQRLSTARNQDNGHSDTFFTDPNKKRGRDIEIDVPEEKFPKMSR